MYNIHAQYTTNNHATHNPQLTQLSIFYKKVIDQLGSSIGLLGSIYVEYNLKHALPKEG